MVAHSLFDVLSPVSTQSATLSLLPPISLASLSQPPLQASSCSASSHWVVAWTLWAFNTLHMLMALTFSFLLLWHYQLSAFHTFNLKTDTYPWLSNRSFPCSMSKTELLISTASLHTLSDGFYIQHHHFPGCSDSICVSHSWLLSFPNNPHPIQAHVLTALPSTYVMQLSHILLWLPAHQSPWDTLTLHNQILALHD